MNLVETLEALNKAPLTTAEAASVREFQTQFQIDDDDPLVIVLAIMIRSQLILGSAPDVMKKMVMETTELHRTSLREQAALSCKEIVGDVASALLSQQSKMAVVWRLRLIWAGLGAGAATLLFVLAIALVKFLK